MHGGAEISEFVLRGLEILLNASLIPHVQQDQTRENRYRCQAERQICEHQPTARQTDEYYDSGRKRQRPEDCGGCFRVNTGPCDQFAR